MADWSNLKSSVASVIKNNENNEITGKALQDVLNNIISNLGANAQFAGVATPETTPGSPDGDVLYLAGKAGVYSNFSQLTLDNGEVAALIWNGSSWTKKSISQPYVNDITTGGADKALSAEMGVRFSESIMTSLSHVEEFYDWAEPSSFEVLKGYYSTDGIFEASQKHNNIKVNVQAGQLLKIVVNYKNYNKNISIVSFWKGENLVSVPLSTNFAVNYTGEFIISVPLGVDTVVVFGSVYAVSGNILSNRSDIEAVLFNSLSSFRHLDSNFEWSKVTPSQYSAIKGFYNIDGTFRESSHTTIKMDVDYGDLIKVELNYSNYSPNIALVSMWNDDKLVYVNLSSNLHKELSDTFIMPIPFEVNNVRILQPYNVYLATSSIPQDNEVKVSKIEGEINQLEIINPNLVYIGEKYPRLGVNNLGKIIQVDWELAVIPVRPNTKYYVSCRLFDAGSAGALGYSADKTVNIGQELQYINMSTLQSYNDMYRIFITDDSTNYLYINLSPLKKDNNVYITQDPKGYTYPTTIGERSILELLNEKSQENFGAKKMVVFGDSITWLALSANPNRGWATHFKEFMGFGEFVNYARSGATWSNTENTIYNIQENTGSLSDNNVIYNQINRLLKDIEDGESVPDYIMILAGTNDQWYPSARPNASSKSAKEIFDNVSVNYLENKQPSECTSIAEAIRYVAEMLIKHIPHAQVILCTPLQGTHGNIDNNIKINDIIRDCGYYMGWNVIEQSKECGISRLQETRGYCNTYDGVHTSEVGAKMVAGILASKCKAILNTMV